jgi:hypothetical protein
MAELTLGIRAKGYEWLAKSQYTVKCTTAGGPVVLTGLSADALVRLDAIAYNDGMGYPFYFASVTQRSKSNLVRLQSLLSWTPQLSSSLATVSDNA